MTWKHVLGSIFNHQCDLCKASPSLIKFHEPNHFVPEILKHQLTCDSEQLTLAAGYMVVESYREVEKLHWPI